MTATVSQPLSIVVLISGRGSNLLAIMDAVEAGELPVRIEAVISNVADAPGLKSARRAGIPTRVLAHAGFDSREAYDAALMAVIDEYHPGLVVLAGFMRILTSALVAHYAGRLINIHPSLLPAFRGLNTHARALAQGVREHGASVHFVTEELDAGAVILQARVAVRADDDARRLAARVLEQEHRIYPEVIRWFAAGRLRLAGDTVYLDGKALQQPVLFSSSQALSA